MSESRLPDSYERCEALVQGSARARPHHDLQCSRFASKRFDFANVALCFQHMEKAERDEELELTDGRTLTLVQESYDEETDTAILVFKVILNVSHFHRAQSKPLSRKELATQLVIRQFGSSMPQLAEAFSRNDALMELAARDMMAAQRVLVESVWSAWGLNGSGVPGRDDEDDSTPKT